MRKFSLLFIVALMALAGKSFGQKAEVLYFKANLSCCQARSCNELEGYVKALIMENFSGDEVSFRAVKLADKDSKPLVDKYDAKSQTVIIVSNGKSLDISDLVSTYSKNRDRKKAKQAIIDKINSML